MFFEKMIWTGSSEPRRDSTYFNLEYVINELGIFCKGEQRSKSLAFAASPMAAPLCLVPVEGTDYAARPLGRKVILWNKITDVVDDNERKCIIVKGNHADSIVLQYNNENKELLLERINSTRDSVIVKKEADETAAAWISWCVDNDSIDVFRPLDDLIEEGRDNISSRPYTDAMLAATVIGDVVKAPETTNAAESSGKFCPSCGAKIVHSVAKFCTNCGTKL